MPCQDEMLSMQLNALKHEAQVIVEANLEIYNHVNFWIAFEQNLIRCVCVLDGCWVCSMFNVVSCGMMSDAWTILDNLGKRRHDRCNDAMTHADRETFHRVQVSPFLITSPDFWRCSVALCFSMLQQYLCAVTPPSTSPSIQNPQQYSINLRNRCMSIVNAVSGGRTSPASRFGTTERASYGRGSDGCVQGFYCSMQPGRRGRA